MTEKWPKGMVLGGYARGNKIVTFDGQAWVYANDGSPLDESRPCVQCGQCAPDRDLPDPCLGWLPGVRFACCGHGVPGQEYVRTDAGVLYESVAEWRAEEGS